MNNWIVLLMLLGWTGQAAQAQDIASGEAPAPVIASLKARYPQAVEARWKKNKSGRYEAHFSLDGKKAQARFEPGGAWLSTERRVAQDQLPAPCRNVPRT